MKVTFFRAQDRIEGFAVDDTSEETNRTEGTPDSALIDSPLRNSATVIAEQWTPRAIDEEGALSHTTDKQFFALYLDPVSKSLVIPISRKIEPRLEGKDDKTDVEMMLELDALHLPGGGIQSGSVRIQVSQDGKFLQGRDALHWVVAAGLDLYKATKDGKSQERLKPEQLRADMAKPFLGRPVTLPGGAGYLKVDVLQDRKLSLLENIWSSIVSLFQSPQGMALAAVVGFPAIGLPAVAFVNQLIEKYGSTTEEAVIKGRQMRWAFNKTALERMKLGSGDLVEIPVMNQGFFVMVPAGRVAELMKTQPRYVSGFGYLTPGSVDMSDQTAVARYLDDVAAGNYPYRDLPYAVVAVELRETNAWKNW